MTGRRAWLLGHGREAFSAPALDVVGVAPHAVSAVHDASPGTDPLAVLGEWLAEARRLGIAEPDAMALATATRDGRPSVRMVLLRGLSERGLRFFTSYESRKAAELDENARAAVVLYWQPLGRQVRVEGRVERLPDAESDAYFDQRPLESRYSARASPQSRVVSSRAALEALWERELDSRDEHPTRPPSWGGYLLVPDRIELWLRGDHRLHDRFCYARSGAGWSVVRLAP